MLVQPQHPIIPDGQRWLLSYLATELNNACKRHPQAVELYFSVCELLLFKVEIT